MRVRGVKGILVTALVTMGAFFAFGVVNGQVNASGDCSANSVIRCGTYSLSELRAKYNSDSTRGTKNIFAAFGLTSNVINKAEVRNGYITKGGDVIVDGKVIASNATTAGRQHMPGDVKKSHNGTVYYERKPSVSFKSNSLSAFVFFNSDGTFAGAVIKDCGNPVVATGKIKPKNPKLTCESLSAKLISRSEYAPAQYSFNAKASAVDGAKITKYTFNFGDGKFVSSTSNKAEHTYTKPGKYTVTLTVHGIINGKATNDSGSTCRTTVNVPNKPEVKVENIEVCDLSTKKIITIKQHEFDSKNHSTNLDDCKEVPVEKTPKIEITKTVNGKKHDIIEENVAFTYELTVYNRGNADLINAVVTDKAPAGVKLTGANVGQVSADGSTWTYTINKLAIGQSQSITLNAVLPKAVAGMLKNTVCVDTPTVPGNPDDCDDATVEVKGPGKVTVCEVETGKIVTVTEEEAKDTSKYGPADDARCKEQPAPEVPTPVEPAPVELPQTGLADGISAVAGLGALPESLAILSKISIISRF